MTLNTGSMLQGRYRIVSQLGQGGMGAVYRAWDTRLNIAVALKEMRPQPGLDSNTLAGLRDQFQQEAVVLARLSHPNLVRVTDFFEEGGNAYLVMDYVEGESLADRIDREGPQPESKVVDWAEQLLDALAYCHNHGILHRDIKPQNVIVRNDNRIIVVDFGLVKLWDPSSPQTKTVMRGIGTPEYAPPEQYDLQQGHTDARTDIYSLGATLYHALTGRIPPSATTRMAIPESFTPPRAVNREISQGLERVVVKAMALAVSERFASAQQMSAALLGRPERAASGPTVVASQRPRPLQPTMQVSSPPGSTPPPPRGTGPQRTPSWSPSPSPSSEPKPSAGSKRSPLRLLLMVGVPLLLIGACAGLLFLLFFNGDPLASITNSNEDDGPGPTSVENPESSSSTPERLTSVPTTGEEMELVIDNQSSMAICYVLISPSESESWGEDRLGGAEVVDSGESRTFSLPNEPHDVMLMDCDQNVMETAWKVEGNTTFTVGGRGTVSIQTINETTQQICYVFIDPSTEEEWSVDRLGTGEVVRPDGGRFFFVAPDTYDLLAQDCDRNTLAEEYNIQILDNITWRITE